MVSGSAEPAVIDLCTPAAKFRVLLALLPTTDGQGFTVTELADRSGASRSSIYRYLDDFEDVGIVETEPSARGERFYLDDDRFAARVEALSERASKLIEESNEHKQDATVSFFT